MKILIVNTSIFALNGITAVIMNYFRHIDKSKIHMDFVAINEIPSEYRAEIESEGSYIYILPRQEHTVVYMYGLLKILKKGKYDAIHVHGNSATMAIETACAFLAGVKNRIVHSHSTSCSYMKIHKLLYPIFSHTYTHALACGEKAGRWLYKDQRYMIYKNGISLKKYMYDKNKRDIVRKELGIENKVVIGHVGNFVPVKNHSFLLEVFLKLVQTDERYYLLLLGDGKLYNSIKEDVNLYGIENSVGFMGRVDNVADYLQAMDMFVLPSCQEGLPVALVEVQAAGLPSIVSDKVDRGVDLTNSISFLPIEETTKWVYEIIKISNLLEKRNRDLICDEWQKWIKNEGYDIENSAKELLYLYLSLGIKK